MYSYSNVPVDKGVPMDVGVPTGGYIDQPDGLGFDWSSLVDNVSKLGLNIYQQQMQLKQVKALASGSPGVPYPGTYGQISTGMTVSPAYVPLPNVGGPIPVQQSGMSTGAMLMIGGLVVGGLLLFTMKRGATA
jgi:hypothetical protein